METWTKIFLCTVWFVYWLNGLQYLIQPRALEPQRRICNQRGLVPQPCLRLQPCSTQSTNFSLLNPPRPAAALAEEGSTLTPWQLTMTNIVRLHYCSHFLCALPQNRRNAFKAHPFISTRAVRQVMDSLILILCRSTSTGEIICTCVCVLGHF